MTRTSVALAFLVLAVPATAAAARAPDRLERLKIQHGRHEALARCGGCHAVEASGASPLLAAPPFRDLNRRYPVADLISAIAEGAPTGHPRMPRFHLSHRDREALVAYVLTVQR